MRLLFSKNSLVIYKTTSLIKLSHMADTDMASLLCESSDVAGFYHTASSDTASLIELSIFSV